MIAILEAYKAGLLEIKNWKTNVIAGLIVGIIALPLAMAFAIGSGVKPEQGIYTAIIAGFIVGIFGGTRTQISGPTGAFVVILAGITAQYGVEGLQIATIMAGCLLFIMGFLRLGNMVKFIPYPLVVGFTSGIGVIIFISQWKDFFGLPITIAIDTPFYAKFILLLKALPHLDIQTTAFSVLSLLLIIFSSKVSKRIPGFLIAIVVTTVLQIIFKLPNIDTIGSVFGPIPQGLPHFTIPNISQMNIITLIIPAFTIAMLGAIESLLSASEADAIAGTQHNPNKELIGQGLANFIAPLWGGFASTGAIARTVTNIKQGGNSPIAAIVHSLVLLLTLLIFAPYAFYIPFSCLAAILFVVALNMSNIPEFIHIIREASWQDGIILVTTFLLTIFIDLVAAVAVGVMISLLFKALRLIAPITSRES